MARPLCGKHDLARPDMEAQMCKEEIQRKTRLCDFGELQWQQTVKLLCSVDSYCCTAWELGV